MANGLYLVAKDFKTQGSICYAMKSEIEEKTLFGAMESIRSDSMQIVMVKGLADYPEYAPYKEVQSAKEFVLYVLNN